MNCNNRNQSLKRGFSHVDPPCDDDCEEENHNNNNNHHQKPFSFNESNEDRGAGNNGKFWCDVNKAYPVQQKRDGRDGSTVSNGMSGSSGWTTQITPESDENDTHFETKGKRNCFDDMCDSPQDTIDTVDTETETFSSEGHSDDSLSLHDSEQHYEMHYQEHCPSNFERVVPHAQFAPHAHYPTHPHHRFPYADQVAEGDEEGQFYDSDQSGKCKGHVPHPLGKSLGQGKYNYGKDWKDWTSMLLWLYFLVLFGFIAFMIGNNVRFEIRMYRQSREFGGVGNVGGVGGDEGFLSPWNRFQNLHQSLQSQYQDNSQQSPHSEQSQPSQYQDHLQYTQYSQQPRPLRNVQPVQEQQPPFWFLSGGLGRSDLEARRADLEVIRRTTAGKIRGFSVRLRTSHTSERVNEVNGMNGVNGINEMNGMTSRVRKDLILASIDKLAMCPKVERIEVDGDVDLVWLKHPSGKVRQLLDTNGDNNADPLAGNSHDSGSHAVLLLDADVALTCNELERGYKIWTKSPDRAVGYVPYTHHEVILSPDDVSWAIDPIEDTGRPYSLISDDAIFVHRRYLHSEIHSTAQEIARGRPCELFVMSLTVSSTSRKPPLGVVANPIYMRTSNRMLRHGEIKSSYAANKQEMSQCVNDVMTRLGLCDLPMEETMYLGRM